MCRSPSVDDDPIAGYKPVRGHKINYLDITNDGLKVGTLPKRSAVRFWQKILHKAQQLVSAADRR